MIDNLFATLWASFGMKRLLERAGFHKGSGVHIERVIFTLALWPWTKTSSINMFSRDGLLQQAMGKDVLYDTLNREDLNWRQQHHLVAKKTLQALKPSSRTAFVVGDSICQRSGRKMPGVSRHFDHTTGRTVKGQQMLALGLSCDEGFVPLDSELYTSNSDVQCSDMKFNDGRSIVARRFRQANTFSKPQMLSEMVKRMMQQGIDADYFSLLKYAYSRRIAAINPAALVGTFI